MCTMDMSRHGNTLLRRGDAEEASGMPAAKDEAYGRPVFCREHLLDVEPDAVERVVDGADDSTVLPSVVRPGAASASARAS